MKRGLRAICHAPLGAILLFPAAALAQASEEAELNQTPAGEIIVTATKQNTALSRVAAAVSAVTAEDIGPGGVQNISDLQVVVPKIDAVGVYLQGAVDLSPTVKLKNITNEFVVANNIIAAATFAHVRVGSVMPPRTYGVTAAFNF